MTFIFIFNAVEKASCEVHKLHAGHWRGLHHTTLTSRIIVLIVAGGLFGLCVWEHLGRAIHG